MLDKCGFGLLPATWVTGTGPIAAKEALGFTRGSLSPQPPCRASQRSAMELSGPFNENK